MNSNGDGEFLLDEYDQIDDLPPYDKFRCEVPEDEARTTSTTLKFFKKLFKLCSYLVFGGGVFVGGLISKTCLMVLVNSAKEYPATTADSETSRQQHDVIRAWSFILVLSVLLFPELLTVVYSLYRVVLKRERPLSWATLLWGGLWEFLHAVGEGILFLKVLPYLDSTFALLLLPLVAIVPCCVNVHAKVTSLTHNANKFGSQRSLRQRNLAFAIVALILQLVGIISLFAGQFGTNWLEFLNKNYTYAWALAGVLLTSCGYWQNFVSTNVQLGPVKIGAQTLLSDLDRSRFKASFVFSLLKSCTHVAMCFLVFVVLENDTYVSAYVTGRSEANTWARYGHVMGLLGLQRSRHTTSILTSLAYAFVTQACCSFFAFFSGRVACLTKIQRESYTFPAVLVTPVISSCSAALAVYKHEVRVGRSLLSFVGLSGTYRSVTNLDYYVDWNTVGFSHEHSPQTITGYMAGFVVVGLVLGWFATILITTFLWIPTQNRLERMEVLFVKPVYAGAAIDQLLLLNRRQFEQDFSAKRRLEDEEEERKELEEMKNNPKRTTRRRASRRLTVTKRTQCIPEVFLCATMWHETEQEMTQILTSLMRMDKDQGNRRPTSNIDPDYYNFQVHILFDDAMMQSQDGAGESIRTTNKYVHQLCELIPLAANKVDLGKGYSIPAPVIYPTPYGGRLEFVMPHGNLLIVHLKDKNKIRHRKRWSQCMYLYYILGYLQAAKRAYKLDDIFLLALDGDVDFQPNALLLLLDRMKRNPDVGAACGRIHPTGSGPVVWFQKFEYAVGHWLQKTAEHVLGCVLCSPGCFSLFRGKALVEVNVMNQYTKKATEALHYVQWDQGEDRWLCTLLLKQGWRIEYSAASDSFTFAPEDFKEFYNQRRRWGPSTMANIFDILLDASLTVRNNSYISWGYISYQVGLMISSILGPSTVVLIVQGAFGYIFKWNLTVSLLVAVIPVILFIILCYTTSADTQIAVAAIMTIIYALIMTAVLVTVVAALASEDNLLSNPNNLFFLALVVLYAFTGIVHPQELTCLLHGVFYYLCIPSAFILLMVYSLVNMNNVSWGTREVKPPPGAENSAQALQEVASKPGKSYQLGPQGSVYDSPGSEGYYSCGLGNLCQCALCIQPRPPQVVEVPVTREPSSLHSIAGAKTTAASMANRLRRRRASTTKYSIAKASITGTTAADIERTLNRRPSLAQLRRMSRKMGGSEKITAQFARRLSRRNFHDDEDSVGEHSETSKYHSDAESGPEESVSSERNEEEGANSLDWALHECLEDGLINYLDDEEREFWKYLIEKYLKPLDEDKAEKEKIKSDLKDLRNKVTGSYFLANALWLILNFALQLAIDDIAISAGGLDDQNPASLVFLVFFVIILVLQFGCMLAHRWSTALHVLSVTSLKWDDIRDGIENTKNRDLEKAEKIHQARQRNRLSRPPPLSDTEDYPEYGSLALQASNGIGLANPVYADTEAGETISLDIPDVAKPRKSNKSNLKKVSRLGKSKNSISSLHNVGFAMGHLGDVSDVTSDVTRDADDTQLHSPRLVGVCNSSSSSSDGDRADDEHHHHAQSSF